MLEGRNKGASAPCHVAYKGVEAKLLFHFDLGNTKKCSLATKCHALPAQRRGESMGPGAVCIRTCAGRWTVIVQPEESLYRRNVYLKMLSASHYYTGPNAGISQEWETVNDMDGSGHCLFESTNYLGIPPERPTDSVSHLSRYDLGC